MKKNLFLLIIIITTHRLSSQQLIRAGGGLPQLTAYSVTRNNNFSFTKNPAALGNLEKPGIGFYAERKYLLEELNYCSLVSAINNEAGGFGAELNYMGTAVYHQANLGLAYGRKLGDVIHIGMELKYDNISVANYGHAGIVSVSAGATFQLGAGLTSGTYFQRAIKSVFGPGKNKQWPGVYAIGFGYDASSKLFMALEFEKQDDLPVNINTWMQYHLTDLVSVSLGLSSANTVAVGGVSFLLRSFELAIISAYHQQLGISPSLRINFSFQKHRQ